MAMIPMNLSGTLNNFINGNFRRPRMRDSLRSSSTVFLPAALYIVLAVVTLAVNAGAQQLRSPGFAGELVGAKADVLQAVNEVLEDQIIHGTWIFDKDRTLMDATVVTSTPLFAPWKGPGKVFYKIRKDAIAPRHFMDSADQGTIAVRYIVLPEQEGRTRVQIDAVYVESTHRTVHDSDGTVESSEYKAIQEHLQAIQLDAQAAADIKRRRDSADLVKQTIIRRREDERSLLASTQSSVKEIEQRLKDLRHEVERRVKAPGTDLKAAPFQSSAKVVSLPAYTEVVIVIVTPHWLGVETPDGRRGWIAIEQLEPLP
ncbi:MAG TPA: hypothetical protein VN037_05630 [Verrucomicrobiae bacterium]|nr:hypothetical protein [Verrucomicrobiae bacterium]